MITGVLSPTDPAHVSYRLRVLLREVYDIYAAALASMACLMCAATPGVRARAKRTVADIVVENRE